MANERRVRTNFLSGTITNNPLASGGTTLSGAALANLEAIDSSEHVAVILDPLGAGNGPEIAWGTAHTASATDMTIARGKEGTTGVEHAQNTPFIIGPLTSDFIGLFTSSTKPSSGDEFVGQAIYTVDDDEVLFNNSAGEWRRPWKMPWGVVGVASITSDASNGASSTVTDISGLSVTATFVANRRIKITAFANQTAGGSSGDVSALYIRESSTTLQRTTVFHDTVNSIHVTHMCVVYLTPTAGSHTYKISASQSNASTGLVRASSTYPALIIVEDIGPNGAAA